MFWFWMTLALIQVNVGLAGVCLLTGLSVFIVLGLGVLTILCSFVFFWQCWREGSDTEENEPFII